MSDRLRRYAKMTLAALLLAPLVLIPLLRACVTIDEYWTYWNQRKHAESYILRVEQFKVAHGYYPDAETIGLHSEDTPFFYLSDSKNYCIGFVIWFDPTYAYCSQNRKWEKGNYNAIDALR